MTSPIIFATIISLFISTTSSQFPSGEANLHSRSPGQTLCTQLIAPAGYPCTEYTILTDDGYLLALHRVSSRNVELRLQRGPPILLQHGLFMAGDAWFLQTPEKSLGYILADQGFDVWVGNVRGTFWSYGHVSFSKEDKEFWDWSWQELAFYDLAKMIYHVYSTTNSKVFIVGHSQGTIMSLAAFTQPNIVEMVEAAALLCPISYLEHVTPPLVLRMVRMHLDQLIEAMEIHQLNFRSQLLVDLVDLICNGQIECCDMLNAISGKNCCLNSTIIDLFFEYEPHPSSTKNIRHLFQMIRQGTFSHYDYGVYKNLKLYGQAKPPSFDISLIPKSLPLWMGYGGNDGLADILDMQHTLKELQSKPELLYLENYGHVDFILSSRAKEDVFDNLIEFFRSLGKSSS